MANANRDQNFVTTKTGVLNTDGVTPINLVVNPSSHGLMISNGTSNVYSPPESLLASYSESNKNGGQNIEGLVFDAWGETFTNVDTITLSSCKFYINSLFNNALTGTAYARLYAHSGTFGSSGVPTGSPLAESDSYDVSALTNNTYRLVTFNFTGANQIELSANTNYCIALYYVSGDGTHSIGIGTGTTSYAGNAFRFNTGGTWQAVGGQEVCFYVYGVSESSVLENAVKDGNFVSSLMGVSSADGITPIPILVDSSGNLLVQST